MRLSTQEKQKKKPVPAVKPSQQQPPKMRVDHRGIAASVTDQILAARDPKTGWVSSLWENPERQRFHQLDLCQDLSGQWLLVDTRWRDKSAAFYDCKEIYLGIEVPPEQIRELFFMAALRRSRQKYQMIACTGRSERELRYRRTWSFPGLRRAPFPASVSEIDWRGFR